jgi:DNA helicase II / ATP-dependent DNA helicase PcrA
MAYSNGTKRTWPAKPYKAPVVKEPRQVRPWSDYQRDIFRDIESGVGNTQVDAYAGSGKTSSIQEGFYHVPAGKNSLMCAFAKPIQIELEKRAPEGVTVLTLHSLGFRASKKVFPRVGKPDDKGEKLWGFIKADRGEEPETYEVREALAKTVSLAKGYLAHTVEEIDAVMDRHDIDPNETRESFIASVQKIMLACKNDTSRMDFDDMIYFPNVHNIRLDKFGYVFIDEAQDLNAAQINIALNSCDIGGRVISVGDERQAIYGFRGADSNAIQNIVDRMHSKRLPLSVTYRCARRIVELAQTFVPGLEAAPNAEDGLVDQIQEEKIEQLVTPGDFILSRTNAPLIKWVMRLLKARIPANIQGRDVGKNLASLVKKSKKSDVGAFLAWLEEYRALEVERMVKAKRDPEQINDKVECLVNLSEGTRTTKELLFNISELFSDKDDHNRVILSTTHKAKGLERNRVFMLSKTYRPGKGIEEDNLTYVAITRAKRELYMVGD